MRGEFKVRGGKLVSVDVEARDGKISTVHVFGDFFLEPDDALEVALGIGPSAIVFPREEEQVGKRRQVGD